MTQPTDTPPPGQERDYFYEHTDGSIHRKPFRVVDMGGGPQDYFDSSFVKRWWQEPPPLVLEPGKTVQECMLPEHREASRNFFANLEARAEASLPWNRAKKDMP